MDRVIPSNNLSKTTSIYRNNNRWIKIIQYESETKFCAETYQRFFNTVDFLPELYDFQWNNNTLKLEYDNIITKLYSDKQSQEVEEDQGVWSEFAEEGLLQ